MGQRKNAQPIYNEDVISPRAWWCRTCLWARASFSKLEIMRAGAERWYNAAAN